jgi:hypothetical protein
MSLQIPFPSSRTFNRLEDYERFHHTRSYIGSLTLPSAPLFRGAEDTKARIVEAMRACGYRSLPRFLEHKRAWDDLRRPIPLAYWDHIGVDRKVLDFTVEVDQEEYEAARRLPLRPTHAVIRMAPAVYLRHSLPEGADERQAVAYLVEKSDEYGKSCCITFPDFKAVTVYPGGKVCEVFYPPNITFTRTHAIPSGDGQRVGTSCVS